MELYSFSNNQALVPPVSCVYILKNFRTQHCYVGSTNNARNRFTCWQSVLGTLNEWTFSIVLCVPPKDLLRAESKTLYHLIRQIPYDLILNSIGHYVPPAMKNFRAEGEKYHRPYGRPLSIPRDQWAAVRIDYIANKITVANIAKKYGISTNTVYSIVRKTI
jgi:hypothetical protein